MDFTKAPAEKQIDNDCLTEYNLGNSQQVMTFNNKFEKFETNSFGTEMDNAGGLGHSMFGNSEISDTQIENRGPSLHERGESLNLAPA